MDREIAPLLLSPASSWPLVAPTDFSSSLYPEQKNRNASSDPATRLHGISRHCPAKALVERSSLAAAFRKSVLNISRSTKDGHILGELETTNHLP
jgi:hypothetical protein